MMNRKKKLKMLARCELSKREFWTYCQTKAPDFYKDDRTFLHDFCDDLQSFIEPSDEHDILVVKIGRASCRERV